MNTIENLKKIKLSVKAKEKKFTHATFIKETSTTDKLSYLFQLPTQTILFSIDIVVKDEKTLLFMTSTNSTTPLEKLDGKMEDVLEWLYHQICMHPMFRLRILTNKLCFKFIKVSGNIVYHHQLAFLTKK